MELKSGDLFFYKKFVGSTKTREVVREEKIEKTKAWNKVNVELFIVE